MSVASAISRPLLVAVLVAMNLSAPRSLQAQPPAEPTEKNAISPAWRTVATARRDTLAELWRLRSEQMIDGYDSDFYLLAVLPDLVATEQKLAENKQEQIEALEEHLLTMKKVERMTQHRYDRRAATIADLLAVQANRQHLLQLLQQLQPDKTRPTVERLAVSQGDLLERAITAAVDRFEKGEIDLKRVVMLQGQLVGALNDKALEGDPRLGGLQRHLDVMQRIEALAKAGFERGTDHEFKYLQAQAARLQAQLALTTAELPADDARTKEAVNSLHQQQQKALQRLIAVAAARYDEGTGTYELVAEATGQLYAAQVAAATLGQRAERLQASSDWLLEMESRTRTELEAGTASRTELLEATERRLSAQLAQLPELSE